MCVVSMIGDDFTKRCPNNPNNPWKIEPLTPGGYPSTNPFPGTIPVDYGAMITRTEFNALKKEVEELKKLLLAAKEYDEKTGQKDCEVEDKVALLKKIAELVGVDLSEVFK